MLKLSLATRHRFSVRSSAFFAFQRGGTFFAKPLPPSKTDCRGRSSSVQRMAPLLNGKSRDQDLKQRFQCRLLLRCPEARRFLTPRLRRHVLRCQRITSLCGPPPRTSVQTARTAQDSARSILGSPLSPSRPAQRGQMTTGKWTDGRGERG